jgi:hypothetical protein
VDEEDKSEPLGEDALRALQEERFELTTLKEQRGFNRLMLIAEQQLESRKQVVFLNPLKKMDDVLTQEYLKGEISGIALFKELTDVRIADLTDQINAHLTQLQENQDEYGDPAITSSSDGFDDNVGSGSGDN